ncbi:MAG: restriction endonuclease subunit S [bacterium]
MKTTLQLQEIATIQTGVYRKPDLYGDIIYLQAKHFNGNGEIVSNLPRDLKYDSRLEKHILKNNDILFAAKGVRNFAFLYEERLGDSIASSTFFVIKIHKKNRQVVLPEYLHWFFNQPQAQVFFRANAKGSSLPSVSMLDLGRLEIPIPKPAEQKRILAFHALWQKEKNITQTLLTKKELLYQEIMRKWTAR